MPVTTINTPVRPGAPAGAALGPAIAGTLNPNLLTRASPPQVAGLVPVFPCVNDECRTYKADDQYDDHQFPLPVFASATLTDPYYNDSNYFLFQLALTSSPLNVTTFFLDKKINGIWTMQATLNNVAYGTVYNYGSICSNINYRGFGINWQKVLIGLGEGIYRFRIVSGTYFNSSCSASPPFCLKAFDCKLADRTVRWRSLFQGGKMGNIEKDCTEWVFCCGGTNIDQLQTTPLPWVDSIRLEGFFGFEKDSVERTKIKYTTGQIRKVRDEAIRRWTWKSGNLPKWAHKRLMMYAFTSADVLLVDDYNVNNADYTIKAKWVTCDAGYEPKHTGYSRYSKVEVDFQDGCQKLYRTRCC